MSRLAVVRMLLLAGLVFTTGRLLHAQGPGGGHGGMGGGPGHGMGMPGGDGHMGGGIGLPRMDRGMGGGRDRSMGSRGSVGSTAGRWWDDKDTAKSLGLNGQQQKRMDSVFSQNREVLQQRYDAFKKAQAKLEALKHNSNASETDLFTEIQRTAQARAELDQAYTHMQLQIRNELTPEQAAKLEETH